MLFKSWSLILILLNVAGDAMTAAEASRNYDHIFRSHHHHHHHRFSAVSAFAAGGFGSSTSSSSSKQGNKHKKTTGGDGSSSGGGGKKRKRGGGSLLDEVNDGLGNKQQQPFLNTPSASTSTSSSPQLDKWGLPITKDDDIFPPMPPGTELIGIDQDHAYSLKEIQHALRDHLNMPGLERYFDEDGVERQRNDNNHNNNELSTNSRMKLRLLHQSPPILAIDNFLTKEECQQVQAVAQTVATRKDDNNNNNRASSPSSSSSPPLSSAYQVNSATFALAQSRRTSTSWFCHYAQVPTLLAKMHHLLGISLEQMEEPQVVRYQSGQEFSWHYDEVPPPQLDNGGQRLVTFLVYLNDVAPGGGGGTVFRDLREHYETTTTMTPQPQQNEELTVQPRQGMACLFFPAFADGRPDDRTLHKGQLLADGHEKWICQIWIHERSYQPVLPPGNSHRAATPFMEHASQQLRF